MTDHSTQARPRHVRRRTAAIAAVTGMALFATSVLLAPMAQAAQTGVPANISTVTDTVSYTSTGNRSMVADIATARTSMYLFGKPDSATWTTTKDPAGQDYVQLTTATTNQFRYAVLTKQVSAYADFTVSGYLNPTTLPIQGSNDSGDWIGAVIIPQKWQDIQANINPTQGGSLGIMGLPGQFAGVPNAYALGVDMYRNPEFNDPLDGPMAMFRKTDSNGNSNTGIYLVYASGQNLTFWGKTLKYTYTYHYNNGVPYFDGSIVDTANGNNGMWFNTATSGMTVPLPKDGVYTVGINAANGQKYQPMKASIDSVSGSVGTASATIKYVVDPSSPVNPGSTVAPSTNLVSATGDVIGLTGVTAGAIAGTDTYTFDGSLPATADAQYKTGWHLSGANSQVDNKPDLTYDMNAANNVYSVYYLPDYQSASVVTDNTDPTGAKTVGTLAGVSGKTMTGWPGVTDATLARTGYDYTIKVTGSTTTYTTFAGAQASTLFDSTSNGTNQTDSAPQVFTVTYKIAQSIIDAANTALTNAKNSNVANEPSVQAAEKTLQDLLNNPAATPQQIQDATSALNQAVTDAQNARQAATNAGNTALSNAAGDTVASNDPAVEAAEKTLQDTLNNPNATTQQIKDATTAVNNAVDNAHTGVADARSKAAAAQAATKPVSNEPAVKQAATALQSVLDNPASTSQQILDATHALQAATDTAKTARDQANTDAGNAISSANAGPYASNPDVKDAIAKLQQIQSAAAADSPSDLTKNIQDATKALNDLIAKQNADRQTAADQANTAIAATAPVSHETATSAALTKLQGLVNDPNSTAQQISDATSALTGAVTSEKTDRNSAVTGANTAIATANGNATDANDPTVQAQIANLQGIMNRAAQDSATDLTKDIVAATSALNTAMQAVDDAKTAAIDKAQTTVAATAPVSNEPDVKQALADLNTVLGNQASSAQQITDATTALQNALDAAKPARATADQAATDSITAAQASPVANDKAVRDAITALQTAQTTAASDSPNALTKDLTALTTALNTAVTNETTAQDTRNTAAQTALTNTSPVSYEPSVAGLKTQLQQTLADPNATPDQVTGATSSLEAATAQAKTERTQKIDDATAMITQVNASDVAKEPSVQAAITHLNSVIDASKTDVATALTKDIQAAMDDLATAYNDAETARQTAVTNANTALDTSQNPVIASDPTVTTARDALQKVLDDPTSTTQQITDATTALNDAIAQGAKAAAAKAINDANASPVSNEQPVKDATSALQTLLNDPASTPQQIMDATTALNDAVKNAETARQAANDKANQAITDSAPMQSVPAVADAKQKLQDLLTDPTATTQQINDAADALNTATKNAAITEAINEINTAQSSPVNSEPAVADAIKNLQNIVGDPNSTPQQIIDATNALKDAVANATTTEDAAKQAAQQALTDAKPVSYEPTVDQARQKLEAALGSATATTADITAATNDLNTAVTPAKTDRTAAVTKATDVMNTATASPVGNEPAVQAAIDQLAAVVNLSDTDTAQALTKDILAQIDAVTAAQQTAQAARDAALADADKAKTASNNPSVSSDPDVAAARDALQKVVDNPASTTQQITDATNAVNTAIGGAGTADQAARDAARAAMGATNPVSFEPSVKALKDQAQAVLNDPTSTTTSVTNATKALTTATDAAKTERNNAITDANTLITTVSGSPVGNEQSVKDAVATLNSVIEASKTDTSSALTKDIKAAMDALTQAQKAAQAARDAAVGEANTAITDSKNTAYDGAPAVGAARDVLQSVLDDPASTTQKIADATDNLEKAIDAASAADAGARADARTALDSAKPVSYEPSVTAARDAVQKALADPAATTDQVTAATNALNAASGPAKGDRTVAIDQANTAITTANGSPVANEQPVKDAVAKLNSVIEASKTDTPNALTADIKKATDDLTAAQRTAQAARDAATTDANTAITGSNDPSVATDPAVAKARDALDTILKDPASTTQQITDATTALTKAVGDATTAGTDARGDAQDAIDNTKPVSYEPGVKTAKDDLQKVLDNPDASLNQMTDATTALTTATDQAKTARDAAITGANTAITTVGGSPIGVEQPIKDAIAKLNSVIEASKTDSATALTSDIAKAMDDLTAVQKTEQAKRDAATTDAGTAITVSNDPLIANVPAVATARNDLQEVLKDPTSTTQTIIDTTTKLNDANRTAAIDAANSSTKTAQSSAVSNEPPVIGAIGDLTGVVGDPTSSAQQILDGTHGLDTAVTDAAKARGDAIDKANTAVTTAVPFMDDPKVATAVDTLTKVMDDPTSTTADIIKATDDLTKATRQAAIDEANKVIKVVETSEVSTNPPVVAAVAELTKVINDPNSTVAQIVTATDNLNKVFADAKAGKTSPVKVSVKTGGQVVAGSTGSGSGLVPALSVAMALLVGAGCAVAGRRTRRPVRQVTK